MLKLSVSFNVRKGELNCWWQSNREQRKREGKWTLWNWGFVVGSDEGAQASEWKEKSLASGPGEAAYAAALVDRAGQE